MTDAGALTAGDHVGIKDSPAFSHWSVTGTVVQVHHAADGSISSVSVRVDGAPEGLPMLPELLVRPGAGDWAAQAFPMDGDAPGPLMYFAGAADALAFVRQFTDVEKDETLKVTPPATAAASERDGIRAAGGVLA